MHMPDNLANVAQANDAVRNGGDQALIIVITLLYAVMNFLFLESVKTLVEFLPCVTPATTWHSGVVFRFVVTVTGMVVVVVKQTTHCNIARSRVFNISLVLALAPIIAIGDVFCTPDLRGWVQHTSRIQN